MKKTSSPSTSSAKAEYIRTLSESPEITGPEMAKIMGVSRQRISQLASSTGIRPAKKTRSEKVVISRTQTGGVNIPINCTAAGVVGELLACADLTARGWTTYAPLVRHGGICDIVAINNADHSLMRVEVRSAARRNGSLRYNKPAPHRYDILALVVTGEPVIYMPELPPAKSMSFMKL